MGNTPKDITTLLSMLADEFKPNGMDPNEALGRLIMQYAKDSGFENIGFNVAVGRLFEGMREAFGLDKEPGPTQDKEVITNE